MLHTLMASAVLMGLAGTPHCLAMCGAACAGMAGPGRWPWGFHLGRLLSYSIAGALAAASVQGLAHLGSATASLRPLWTLVHVAALALGVVLLWRGRQPAWMEGLGSARSGVPVVSGSANAVVHGPGGSRAWRSAAAGLAWAAWPCGLLQSALLVAALANGPAEGALVMAGFASASAGGLMIGPALWWRLAGGRGAGTSWLGPALAVRLAGLSLALASAWALGHGLWMRVAAWCFS